MKRPLIILSFLFVLHSAGAQDGPGTTISGRFDSVFLRQLIQEVESRAGLFFYYDKKDIDSIKVTLVADQEPVGRFLERALTPQGLLFSVDSSGRVFITKGIRLVTTLPSGVVGTSPIASTLPVVDSVHDYGLQVERKRTPVSPNKLYEIGGRTNSPKSNAIVTGNVYNSRTGEPVVNASVFVDNRHASVTDAYGHYSLNLPGGKQTLNILAIGMKDAKLQVMVYGDGKLDVDLQEQVTTLKEVVVSSRKTVNVMQVQMGVDRLTVENIKRVPSVFGEADILRVVTTLPGVKTVGEASTGFNVRGGSADQNLILLNDATIYNPSHFFGMFSAFNPELVKEIELYKSSIPAKFGGRLASVLDISTREGNKKNITGSAGLGIITSRVNIEGPLVKNRTSFIFGGRSTYANWLLNLLPKEYKNSRASFQDVNLGISHRIDSLSNLYLSAYLSSDRFKLNSDTVYGYTNRNFNVKWKKSFTNKLNAEFVAGIDEYRYKVFSDSNRVNAFTLRFGVRQWFARAGFTYFKSQQHSFEFGLGTTRYQLNPGSLVPKGDESIVVKEVIDREQALESAGYVSHKFNPNNKLSISSGLRYSIYNYLGPQRVHYYAAGLPVTPGNVVETKDFGKGKFIETYQGPEIRFSVRYAFTSSFSIKTGYNSQRQYIHMLSNTTAIAPTDIWKLSDPNIRPQRGDQVSFGIYKNLKSNTIETSVEVYYKRIYDYLDYKPGATLVMNQDVETEVVNTEGKAYGVELLVKKPGGKLTGWISYTYSRILLKSGGSDLASQVNKGEYYPANYDKPHDVTLTGTFRVNHRFSLSVNSTYSTGRPITLPIGRYYYGGSVRVLYSERNKYRIPDYVRTDFSMNIDGNHKVRQATHNSWTIGVYNLLARKNPYSVYFVSENGSINGYRLSIFGTAIPFINYTIRF